MRRYNHHPGYFVRRFLTVEFAAVVAVHMDVVNHMSLSRKELREFVQETSIQDRVMIPEDGEHIKF